MNLTMLLDMAADGFGDRVVIGPRDGGLTASRLRALASRAAGRVRESGAEAVVYLAENGPAFPVALFAAAFAGVPLVPVNYRLGDEQLDRLLAGHPGAYGIAGDDRHEALHGAGLSARTPAAFLRAAGEAGASAEEAPPDPEATAVLIYTSGTTSEPKGVVLRHRNRGRP